MRLRLLRSGQARLEREAKLRAAFAESAKTFAEQQSSAPKKKEKKEPAAPASRVTSSARKYRIGKLPDAGIEKPSPAARAMLRGEALAGVVRVWWRGRLPALLPPLDPPPLDPPSHSEEAKSTGAARRLVCCSAPLP